MADPWSADPHYGQYGDPPREPVEPVRGAAVIRYEEKTIEFMGLVTNPSTAQRTEWFAGNRGRGVGEWAGWTDECVPAGYCFRRQSGEDGSRIDVVFVPWHMIGVITTIGDEYR